MNEVARIKVNGKSREVTAPRETPLLEVLRDDLGLTGAKYGCGEAMCGACTVLVGGEAVRSCVTTLEDVGDAEVETIESCAKGGTLDALQQAFLDHGAMQCAYCVSGMIMSAHALLRKNPDPSEEEIVAHMEGNVCRCGGHPRMMAAIKGAAKAMRGER